MQRLASIGCAAMTAIALSACTTGSPAPHAAQASPATVFQGHLVGPNQMTLYVYDRDAAGSGTSSCYDTCATNWPALLAPAHAQAIGHWSVVTRSDGNKQWAYQGKPLYYWIKDSKPGDTSGHGVGNVWRTATP